MRFFIVLACWLVLFSCEEKEFADLILINGVVYTVDTLQPTAEAIAVKGDKILKVGSTAEIQQLKGPKTEEIDLAGKFVMPGLIEGHGHFSGLGKSLMQLNFLKSKDWDEIVQQVSEAAKVAKSGEWIEGRGWHQEKWDATPELTTQGYPHHHTLSASSPYNPVVLKHASGHSLFANAKAMALAGVTKETPDPRGGTIIRDAQGNPIGVFEERAMDLINAVYQNYLDSLSEKEVEEKWQRGIELAEEECLRYGITSFQDAGATFEEIERYRKLAAEGKLDLHLWTMVRHNFAKMKDSLGGFPIIGEGNNFFTCRAIKSEVDGALGSYGAWLLAPYNDKPDFTGQNTTTIEEVKNIAGLAMKHNMQLCVHAIGDRANRETLNLMEETMRQQPNSKDLRWRIEHSQHMDPADIPRFKTLGVIASMQGIHCTSDAPFVVKRLGEERARAGAYAWRSLLDAGAVVTNGTDAPVEDVNPFHSLYATVTRKRADTGMEFFPEQCLTREEGIYSYTLANAIAAFEEKQKGSLAPGKLADIVVLSTNIATCPPEDILKTEALMTIVSGKIKLNRLGKN
jgi:hypothetical protein